jgi:hypothetical protein
MYDEGSPITAAISGIDELEYLREQDTRRISAMHSEDYPLVVDTSKSLLECIFKTIINDRVAIEKLPSDMKPLYAEVRKVLTLSSTEKIQEDFTKVSNTIVHIIAEIRNRFGVASHANDGRFENPISKSDAVFLHRLTDALGSFLLLRHRQTSDPNLSTRLNYIDQAEFNEWLDQQKEGFTSLDETVTPYSEALFKLDPMGYREMYLQFVATEEEDLDRDTEQ